MNLTHLTDNELLDHVIKYDTDPIRVRLATHMQRVQGAIIDELVYAGMDETFCEFRSVVTEGKYLPGQYISHLENEIEFLQNEVHQHVKEIADLQARSVADLIQELNQQITTEKYLAKTARDQQREAEVKANEATHKLDMWAILNR